MNDRILILNDRTRFGGETGAGLMRNRCSFTSKDQAADWDSAFTYAIVFGWGPDPDDPEDENGAWSALAEAWGWDEHLVEFLRDAHERFAALPDRMADTLADSVGLTVGLSDQPDADSRPDASST